MKDFNINETRANHTKKVKVEGAEEERNREEEVKNGKKNRKDEIT